MAHDRHPYEWVRDMTRVADDKLVRDLVRDFAGYNPSPRSPLNQPPQTVQVQGAGRVVSGSDAPVASSGTGWANSPEIRPPDGLQHIDRMLDEEDRIWRAQRIREVAEAAAVQQALAEAQGKVQEEQQPKPTKEKGPKT